MRKGRSAGSVAARLTLVAVLTAAACSPVPPAESPVSILLIGNSYSIANDLPAMITELAAAGDKTLSAELVAEGGWSLGDHANSQKTRNLIGVGTWDYVVLQEQSVIPSLRDYREEFMFPAARVLDDANFVCGSRHSPLSDLGS